MQIYGMTAVTIPDLRGYEMIPFFSIVVVCLNPGEKLLKTMQSIQKQEFQDYEIILKDGGSTDGSLEKLDSGMPGLNIVTKPDLGIYDAMNQAVGKASGRFVFFLNCGDWFLDEQVLAKMHDRIIEEERKDAGKSRIYYGDVYERVTRQLVSSNPRLDAFGCYRNVPCHQACFYERTLLIEHPFQLQYKVRADYEQFLWCFFRADANPCYTGITVADYEGGGFSETKRNLAVSKQEHKEIVRKYMSSGQRFTYRLILCLTLAPLRTRLSKNERTAAIYNKLKALLYRGHLS